MRCSLKNTFKYTSLLLVFSDLATAINLIFDQNLKGRPSHNKLIFILFCKYNLGYDFSFP